MSKLDRINLVDNIIKILPVKNERIYIDDIIIDDLIIIQNFMNDELISMTCRPIEKLSKNDEKEVLKKMKQSKTSYCFGIYKVAKKSLIGRIRCFDYNPRNGSIEIGYFILPKKRSCGYAFEAISLVLKVLFSNPKINKIIAQTGEFNMNSIKLLKKLNFKKDGILRNHHKIDNKLYDDYIFSLLRKEYTYNI